MTAPDTPIWFSSEKLGRMFLKHPERMDWWPRREAGCGKTIRNGETYADIRRIAHDQGELRWCDDSGCGRSECTG